MSLFKIFSNDCIANYINHSRRIHELLCVFMGTRYWNNQTSQRHFSNQTKNHFNGINGKKRLICLVFKMSVHLNCISFQNDTNYFKQLEIIKPFYNRSQDC